jgi:predicted GH43/DUF377 family glycosyl hydrolase
MFYGTFQSKDKPVAIGYATSEDGFDWTKYDGNPVLQGDESGFDAFGVTRPVVIVTADNQWVMYYNGIPKSNNVFGQAIGRATAPALAGPWRQDEVPVLEVGRPGEWDARFLFPDSVIEIEDEYLMYYSSGFQTGRATSADRNHLEQVQQS